MNPLVKLIKTIRMRSFNHKNQTNIRSLYANLNAKYGKYVKIDQNTRVSADVTIGDFSYVNHSSSLQNCDVGKYCSISSGVWISPYNHNKSGITTHPVGDYDRTLKRVKIGNDVLISLNVIIMEGVHIGDGVIIGAGGVVTHDIGPYEIWGGVPAKFIHYRVPNEKARNVLEKIKWWDMDEDDLNKVVEKYKTNLNGIESMEFNYE